MSDKPSAGTLAVVSAETQEVTAGMLLRRAREASGMHLGVLAVALKVPVKKLEALEADRLDQLPDAVFVRALAASVCRTLKVDAMPILDMLPKTRTPKLDTEQRGINAPFDAAQSSAVPGVMEFLKLPAVRVVAVILSCVLALAFLPETLWTSDVGPSADAPVDKDQPVMPIDAAKDAVTPTLSGPASVALASAVTTTSTGSGVLPEPLLSASSAVSAANPAFSVLTIRATGENWVEVVDARGVVQVRRTMSADETVQAGGTLPLSVVIGRAHLAHVEVRGQAFNVDGISKDNVARFEVK